jgi:hypothetical protein
MTGNPELRLTPSDLAALQGEQLEHDSMYHQDVYFLPRQERLRHLVFHFAKYSGRTVDCQSARDPMFVSTVVDTFIIAMSARHVLTVPADDFLTWDLRGLEKVGSPFDHFRVSLTRETGKMAKACEAYDHLENLDYLNIYRNALDSILRSTLGTSFALDLDLASLVRKRWRDIESKHLP